VRYPAVDGTRLTEVVRAFARTGRVG